MMRFLYQKMNGKKGKIVREKAVVGKMIDLYCRHRLHLGEVPEEYVRLREYAWLRLDHCRFGEHKKTCKRCPVHCYARDRREAIRRVMRWAGPHMLLYDPWAALRHLLGW